MTPAELKATCDEGHGTVPFLGNMKIQTAAGVETVAASWRGLNRRIGHEVTIQTAGGTRVHKFLTKKLASME